ncbi:MAG TPA: hypothetical protein PLK58_03370 [Candidatus Rifleibacterium sp.]|nr:hypothetical protein [Candidatus Rifleibacterium sp.]HPW57654.1 hypothetical protein [Candidatus Rifleibacterium sp.]
MSVEIEKTTEARQYTVFLVVNEYLSATLRGNREEIEKAWKALIKMQESDK